MLWRGRRDVEGFSNYSGLCHALQLKLQPSGETRAMRSRNQRRPLTHFTPDVGAQYRGASSKTRLSNTKVESKPYQRKSITDRAGKRMKASCAKRLYASGMKHRSRHITAFVVVHENNQGLVVAPQTESFMQALDRSSTTLISQHELRSAILAPVCPIA